MWAIIFLTRPRAIPGNTDNPRTSSHVYTLVAEQGGKRANNPIRKRCSICSNFFLHHHNHHNQRRLISRQNFFIYSSSPCSDFPLFLLCCSSHLCFSIRLFSLVFVFFTGILFSWAFSTPSHLPASGMDFRTATTPDYRTVMTDWKGCRPLFNAHWILCARKRNPPGFLSFLIRRTILVRSKFSCLTSL